MGVARVFFDQDMRNGFTGFREILKKKRIPAGDGEKPMFFMFVNKHMSYVKIFSNIHDGGMMISLRKDKGRLSMEDIERIPQLISNKKFFGGDTLNELRGAFGEDIEISAA